MLVSAPPQGWEYKHALIPPKLVGEYPIRTFCCAPLTLDLGTLSPLMLYLCIYEA